MDPNCHQAEPHFSLVEPFKPREVSHAVFPETDPSKSKQTLESFHSARALELMKQLQCTMQKKTQKVQYMLEHFRSSNMQNSWITSVEPYE